MAMPTEYRSQPAARLAPSVASYRARGRAGVAACPAMQAKVRPGATAP
jgi:hypothetical protein